MTQKVCTKCGETKPLDAFYKAKGTRDGLRGDCKTCFAARAKRWYDQNKDHVIDRVQRWRDENPDKYAEYQREYRARPDRKIADRAGHLKRKFGISLEDYDRLLAEQGGGCAICSDPPEPGGNLHVDHDHADGRVRGLLCVRCNNGLGQFKEEPELIQKAVSYAGREADHAEVTARIKARARQLVAAR